MKSYKNTAISLLVVLSIFCFVQLSVAQQKPEYWKTHKPTADYWQQDIAYKIKANIDEKTNVLDGYEELTYTNNSPNELNEVFFHLYQNAFQPQSYFDNLSNANGIEPVYGNYQRAKLGTVVENITSNGKELKLELDNTILHVLLEKPIKSGESITFKIMFKTYFDETAPRGRMRVFTSFGTKQFNGGGWYPRISVYDRKFGWTADQHLVHEFYGDFGTYDVELTFANNYIVEGTGRLANESDVLPAELKKKLDVKNFKDKPIGDFPSIIIPYDSTKHKTWKYHAENVHDFAFVANPAFRLGEASWNNIKCVSIVRESYAARWQTAADIAAQVIQLFSEDYGMYAYPKIVVADAESGMEYPMLTMDGGLEPDFTYVFAHEIGHNWFYGMLGTNETYRAAMDEGFTQFLTVWGLEKISKNQKINSASESQYITKFQKDVPLRYKFSYLQYLNNALKTEGAQINTHSDYFITNEFYGSVYRQSYYKTATMLFNLQYVLGDEFFQNAMKNYFNQWKFCHPYFEDFKSSVMSYTHVDLNWFFDEWFETNKTIDYAVRCVKRGNERDEYKIKFKRKGLMQMPIDFTVISKDDSVLNYHIPNTWFVKKTNATVLTKWTGWNNLNKTYTAKVIIPEGIKDIIIDTTNRLADVNMLNNSKKLPVDYTFDYGLINLNSDWTKYEIVARPDLWWNGLDGIKLGFHIDGNYMNYLHVANVDFWMNSGVLRSKYAVDNHFNNTDHFSFIANYSTATNFLLRNSRVSLSAKQLDGLDMYAAELSEDIRKFHIYFNVKSMFRRDSSDLNYLLYPSQWDMSPNAKFINFNNTCSVGAEYKNSYHTGTLFTCLNLKSSAPLSDYNFSQVSLTIKNIQQISLLKLNTRLFVQYGSSTYVPGESALYLAGSNPEDMMENKYTRSFGFETSDWVGYGLNTNHYQYGGGLNLRGYSGYLVAEKDKWGNVIPVYKGNTGAALNVELEFDQLFNIRPKNLTDILGINTYLFGDVGVINKNKAGDVLLFANMRADAGLGTSLTIKKWWYFQKAKPLTIRFDIPFYLSNTPAIDTDNFKFRWIVGISRAF